MKKNDKYPNIANFNPSSCISRKMMKCNRIIANILRKHISKFKISDSQLSILFITSKISPLNQKKIGEMLLLEKSTVNRNLKRLLENKLLAQESNHHIILTTKGKLLLEDVIPHWQTAMAEIRETLKEDGEESLNLMLNKLSQKK